MLVIFLRKIFKLKNLFLRSKLLWLYSFLVMILVTFTPKVVFARMGSSGGHSGGGGHSSGGIGGGSGHSFNSSGYSDGSSYNNSSTNIVIFLAIIAFCCVSPSTTSEFILLFGFLFLQFIDAYAFGSIYNYSLLKPNMTIVKFMNYLSSDDLVNLEEDLKQTFIDLYGRAQFAYGDAIRRKYTGQKGYLSELKKYLGHTFLYTMKREILAKCDQHIIDDVIVSRGEVIESYKISKNVFVIKIKAIGVDREVNQDSDFNASFETQSWEDYVVFGRRSAFEPWVIYNIVYGNRFHLNGDDFNDQDSLLSDQHFFETKLPNLTENDRSRMKMYSKHFSDDIFSSIANWIGVLFFIVAILLVVQI